MATGKLNIEQKLDRELTSYFRQDRDWEVHFEAVKKVTYEDFLSNKMLIIVAIREGIPYSIFDLIQHYTPFTETDWANFLDISTKSLQRYRQVSEYYFKSLHSEKIIEMAEVTKAGLDVFGDMDKLKLWLNTPNFSLGKLKPIELLKDSYGKELVLSELIRINHGILV
jgi:putative toxin-antitoxin system antitoxin component (TIGR02293 family)